MLQSGSTFIFHYRKSLGDQDQKHVVGCQHKVMIQTSKCLRNAIHKWKCMFSKRKMTL